MEKFLDLVQKNCHKLIHFNPNAGIIPAEYNNNVVDVTQNN